MGAIRIPDSTSQVPPKSSKVLGLARTAVYYLALIALTLFLILVLLPMALGAAASAGAG